jgi:hypothetical protein
MGQVVAILGQDPLIVFKLSQANIAGMMRWQKHLPRLALTAVHVHLLGHGIKVPVSATVAVNPRLTRIG